MSFLARHPMSDIALEQMMHWVSAIADNIRNPVSGMSAALDIMTREIETRRRTGQCNEGLIDDACSRMRVRFASLHEYITELVDFGRPLSLLRESSRLGAFFQHIENDFRQTVSGFGPISFVLEIAPEDLDSVVYVDQKRLISACKALLRNASEAALVSVKPVVRLSSERSLFGDSDGIVIEIEDSGPGFDANQIGQVFEPFFSTKEAGTGLGLAVAKRYVEVHGGHVTLGRSEELAGAKVSLWLPAFHQEESLSSSSL